MTSRQPNADFDFSRYERPSDADPPLPAWATDGYPEPRDVETENRLRSMVAFAEQLPNWCRSAPKSTLLRAIHDHRLVRAAEAFGAKPTNLVLLGPTGVGKTTALAYAVRCLGFDVEGEGYHRRVRARMESNQSLGWARQCAQVAQHGGGSRAAECIVWTTAFDLVDSVRRHPLGEGEPQAVSDATSKRVLVLDDLGNERAAQGSAEALLDVLDRRYRTNSRTITSSGLTREQLLDRYGQAFVRRLEEVRGEGAIVVDCFTAQRKVRAV